MKCYDVWPLRDASSFPCWCPNPRTSLLALLIISHHKTECSHYRKTSGLLCNRWDWVSNTRQTVQLCINRECAVHGCALGSSDLKEIQSLGIAQLCLPCSTYQKPHVLLEFSGYTCISHADHFWELRMGSRPPLLETPHSAHMVGNVKAEAWPTWCSGHFGFSAQEQWGEDPACLNTMGLIRCKIYTAPTLTDGIRSCEGGTAVRKLGWPGVFIYGAITWATQSFNY